MAPSIFLSDHCDVPVDVILQALDLVSFASVLNLVLLTTDSISAMFSGTTGFRSLTLNCRHWRILTQRLLVCNTCVRVSFLLDFNSRLIVVTGEAMIIDLDTNHRIKSTEMCWQIETPKTVKGKTRWHPFLYYPTMESALRGAAQRELRLDPAHGVHEALDAVNRLTLKYAQIFDNVGKPE